MLNFNHWETVTDEEEEKWEDLKMWLLDALGSGERLKLAGNSCEFLLTYISKLQQDSARLNTLDSIAQGSKMNVTLQAVVPNSDPPFWIMREAGAQDELGDGYTVREVIDKYRVALLQEIEDGNRRGSDG